MFDCAISLRRPFICGMLLGLTTLAGAATLTTKDARITEVTVYRDRAEVIREAAVQMPAGASSVEFAGIPVGVEPDSLRVTAEGVPSVLGAVEIVEFVEDPGETPELVAAREEVRRLEREIAAEGGQQGIDKELRDFLNSLRATTAQTESIKLGEGRADPEAISAFYDMFAEKLGALSGRELERADRVRALREELVLARARLQTVRPPGNIRSRIATIEIEASRAGSLTLRLAYVVPRASWYPSYRATLDADTGDVKLVAEGVVRQQTGEDWSGVALRLSTASPSQGVEPPFLTPWLIGPVIAYAARAQGAFEEMEVKDREVPERFYQNTLTLAPDVADAPSEPAAMSEANLVKSAYNVAFGVPGRSDVPADSRDHRVVLRSGTLRGNVVHRTVPGLDSRAYLTSVTTSPTEYPLLAGPVRVFAEGAYLGRYRLEETGPGKELTIPFGVDNRLEVIRVPLPKSAGREGFAGRQREIEFGFRTELHNLLDRPATVVFEDRVPVSEDERVVVELSKKTTAGFKDSPRRPGVKIWTLELAAGEKRELIFAYTVRHPKDLVLSGM